MTIIILLGIAIGFVLYFMYRNTKVCKFRIRIIELCADYERRRIREGEHDPYNMAFDWCFAKIPGYESMILSFKPLTLENWLTSEMNEKLLK